VGATRDLLATGAPVWLPINPIEYHGPHLPLSNDHVVSMGLARDIHARLGASHPDRPLLVAPDPGVGSGCVPGPGSRPFPPAVVREVVLRSCRAVADLGAKRVVLMTFHGDPMHNLCIQDGVDFLAARGIRAVAPTHVLIGRMVDAGPSDLAEVFAAIADPDDRAAAAADVATDFHAGFLETSLTLHYAPAMVSSGWRDLPPCPPFRPAAALALAARAARLAGAKTVAAELAWAAGSLGWFGLDPFPGYSGRPGLARAEAGAVLARVIADGMAPVVDAVLEGRAEPPRPSLRWMRPLTLGGRIGYA
jgi:creatinine amidohydrolase